MGDLLVSLLDAYYWRDWMPEVSDPGPDQGTPLRTRIWFRLDNSAGEDTRLGVVGVLYGPQGLVYELSLRMAPKQGEVTRDYILRAGATREIELLGNKGPYLPVGSSVNVVVYMYDSANHRVAVHVPDAVVQRTD